MNARKFYLILCLILSFFLFAGGIVILTYLNNSSDSRNSNPVSSFLDPLKPFKSKRDPVNILVLGGDMVNKNTDTILLVNFNPSTAKLNIMSIPRDTKVSVKGSSVPKVNSAYPVGGAQRAVDTVSNLLGVKINYCVFVDTTGVAKIIDKLDGVEFDVPANMDYEDPEQNLFIHLKKGEQHLNGQQVVQFMRFRQANQWNKEIMKYYDGSDIKRIEAQQKMITEIIRQKATVFFITKVNEILKLVFQNVETNLTLSDTLKMTHNLSKLSAENLNMVILPGKPVEEGLSYYMIDKPKTAEVIRQYFQSPDGLENKKDTTANNKESQKAKQASTKKSIFTPAPADGTKAEPAKDNPSNRDLSIQGTAAPVP